MEVIGIFVAGLWLIFSIVKGIPASIGECEEKMVLSSLLMVI